MQRIVNGIWYEPRERATRVTAHGGQRHGDGAGRAAIDNTADVTAIHGVIDNIDLSLGSWNSIQSNQTGATSAPANWYESDVLVGLTMGLWGFMSTNLTYAAYTFPNGVYSVAQDREGELRSTRTQRRVS